MSRNQKDSMFSNIQKSQFNFAQDNATLKATFTVNGEGEQPEKKLKLAISKLLETIRKDTAIASTAKQTIEAKAEAIIEDIEDENISSNRLSRFRDFINRIGPELQISAVLAASISGVKDAIDLYVG